MVFRGGGPTGRDAARSRAGSEPAQERRGCPRLLTQFAPSRRRAPKLRSAECGSAPGPRGAGAAGPAPPPRPPPRRSPASPRGRPQLPQAPRPPRRGPSSPGSPHTPARRPLLRPGAAGPPSPVRSAGPGAPSRAVPGGRADPRPLRSRGGRKRRCPSRAAGRCGGGGAGSGRGGARPSLPRWAGGCGALRGRGAGARGTRGASGAVPGLGRETDAPFQAGRVRSLRDTPGSSARSPAQRGKCRAQLGGVCPACFPGVAIGTQLSCSRYTAALVLRDRTPGTTAQPSCKAPSHVPGSVLTQAGAPQLAPEPSIASASSTDSW